MDVQRRLVQLVARASDENEFRSLAAEPNKPRSCPGHGNAFPLLYQRFGIEKEELRVAIAGGRQVVQVRMKGDTAGVSSRLSVADQGAHVGRIEERYAVSPLAPAWWAPATAA